MSDVCTCARTGAYCPRCRHYAALAGVALPTRLQALRSAPQTAGQTSPPSRRLVDDSERFVLPSITMAVAPSYRSKTEARYAALLAHWQHEGQIVAWWYEPIRLALAPRTTYTPDFLVHGAVDTPLTFIEVKGAFIREKGWVKAKIAARLYPIFRFRLVQWQRHGQIWLEQDIPS